MSQKSQIIQCQCGTIYVTKNLNFARAFHCPGCGETPTQENFRQNTFPHYNTVGKTNKFNLLAMISQLSLSGIDNQGYFKFNKLKIFAAPIYIHWLVLTASSLIFITYWQSPLKIILAILSYFSIIFIHEVGHGAMASKLGYRVFAIRVGLIHGLCEYEQPRSELDDVKISWSGVLLQIMIAILVFSLSSMGLNNFSYFSPMLVFLGYFSLLIVPYNLMPLRGLDGQKAWRIIPLIYQQLKNRNN
ncbi:MAG: hypothetical protein AAF298_05180 [Cyanobacteria bacterium P01_A01_bin.40]